MLFEVPVSIITWAVVLVAGLYLLNKGNKSKEEVVRESLPWIGSALIAIGIVNVSLCIFFDYIL